ncbi:MAG: 30S ribosomal protein S18 [Acidobacteria bacterium]|nr:30S ribosomal protein S18 [Acidobacteriota bacterium]
MPEPEQSPPRSERPASAEGHPPRSEGPASRGRGRGREGGRRFFRRRKVCKFCAERVDHIDYKDVKLVGQFVTDRGKIMPRRLTGTCSSHQRQLKVAIKRARNIALLPFAATV